MKKSPNAIDRFVGERIKARRREVGLNQSQLAEPLGVTYQQIQKYEAGNSRVGAGRLQQIAVVLNVPIAYFFDGAPSVGLARQNSDNSHNFPDYVSRFIGSEEGLAIARAFNEIENRRIKESISSLIQCVATAGSRK